MPASKLGGYGLYRQLGSPRLVVAPMVDQSELAWRMLSRLYGAELCYTPMIHAALFSDNKNHPRYRAELFNLDQGEEGDELLDRPLIAQFCANDPDTLAKAVGVLEGTGRVDAVDLNLGCPQGIAKKGRYGAFLMEDWDLIRRLISHIDETSTLPITAKFRCYDSPAQTIDYATHIHASGAQILTLHGRTRTQKGPLSGLADWAKIASVKSFLSTRPPPSTRPLFANGNILINQDVDRCMAATGADGVMSAEGNLHNPAIYLPSNPHGAATYRSNLPARFRAALDGVDALFPPPVPSGRQRELDEAFPDSIKLGMQYLAICRALRTPTASSAIKGHLYKLWRPIFAAGRHLDVRDRLGRTGSEPSDADKGEPGMKHRVMIQRYWDVALMLKEKLDGDRQKGDLVEAFTLPSPLPPGVPLPNIPYSRAQPYFRTLSVPLTSTASGIIEPSDLQSVDERDPKRARLEPTSGICTREGCVNVASAKCPRGGCKSCCASLPRAIAVEGEGDGEGGACEGHLARFQMEKERRQERAALKAAKRARVEKSQGKKQQQQRETTRQVLVDA